LVEDPTCGKWGLIPFAHLWIITPKWRLIAFPIEQTIKRCATCPHELGHGRFRKLPLSHLLNNLPRQDALHSCRRDRFINPFLFEKVIEAATDILLFHRNSLGRFYQNNACA
jgi:hypothetical protein